MCRSSFATKDNDERRMLVDRFFDALLCTVILMSFDLANGGQRVCLCCLDEREFKPY